MKRKFVKILGFCLFFIMLINLSGNILKPARQAEVGIENYHADYEGIYELEENMLDAVWIGSSHVYCSISPEDIFASEGIASYVLASPAQKVWQSYYYLKDVLQRQKPKAVVLDVFMCLDAVPQSEPANREAYDPMKLSKVKFEAVKTAVDDKLDQEDFLSYFLPVLRYHDRWESLEESDFLWFLNDPYSAVKGYMPKMAVESGEFNRKDYENSSPIELDQKCRGYLQKMQELCNANQAEFILAKFPTCLWDGVKSATIQHFADDAGIPYLDFCADEQLREAVDIDWSTDTMDLGNHLNYDGSMKITAFMGKYLSDHFSFTDKRKDTRYNRWKRDYAYYKRSVADYEIYAEENLSGIADRIGEDYIAVISVDNVSSDMLAGEDREALRRLGIGEEQAAEILDKSNLTILENGSVIYQSFHEIQTKWNGTIDENRWKISSIRNEAGSAFSCLVNEKEKVSGSGGIRIVIWDKRLHKFVGCRQFSYNE